MKNLRIVWSAILLIPLIILGALPVAADEFPDVVLVKDINPGSEGSSPSGLTEVFEIFATAGGALFFVADDGTHGYELWKSDGTAGGTVLVKDINPGSEGSYPEELTDVGGTFFFKVDDGIHGWDVWKSDGTGGGTVIVKDINPGSGDYPRPEELTDVAGTLFFRAKDGPHGYELWKSDGTEGGTVMVKDIDPGGWDSHPGYLTDVAGTLFFKADDGTNGRELWRSEFMPISRTWTLTDAEATRLAFEALPGSSVHFMPENQVELNYCRCPMGITLTVGACEGKLWLECVPSWIATILRPIIGSYTHYDEPKLFLTALPPWFDPTAEVLHFVLGLPRIGSITTEEGKAIITYFWP